MKKLYMIISMMLLTMFAAVAQAPERFSYQAVVRNANNQLVTNANVGVRVSVLQGSTTGSAVYVETHTAGTNANGLLTVEIGGGNTQQGSFQGIDWGSGSYFLKTEVDPNGGSNYSITSVQQLMSVPYALYAKTASNGFSGNIADYLTPATIPSFLVALQQAGVAMQSDIPEIPEIPTVPTNVSAFNNDAGYITAAQLPVIPENQVLSISNDTIFLTNGGFVKLPAATVGFSGDYNDLTNKPQLFSGDYNDLTNKPVIPTVPENVSAFTNDAGYITESDLPAIPVVPTDVSALNNDAGYITSAAVPTFAVTQTDTGYVLTMTPPDGAPQHYVLRDGKDGAAGLPGLPGSNGTDGVSPTITVTQGATGTVLTITDVNGTNQYVIPSSGGASGTLVQLPANWNETDPTSPQFILNKPELFSGNYEDLQNKPELFSGDYNDLTNKPVIPSVPTNVSEFTNDAGYITEADLPAISTVPTNVSAFTNDAGYITEDDLPAIPTVPTDVSAFNNDAGYITAADIPAATEQVNADWNATEGAAEILNKPEFAPVATSGNYNDLTNKPNIPTKLSQLTNDVGFISQLPDSIGGGISTETDPLFSAWDKDYNDLTNKPELFSGNYEDLQNKPELFSGDYNDLTNKPVIPSVPTNVSEFTNDAGYITEADLPATPAVPTKVSELENDANYITADDIPAATEQVNADWNATEGAAQILNKPEFAPVATSGNYNDLTNKPVIPSVPENVSAFTNDAGYITEADLPAMPTVPTNVSAFTNDAGYITEEDLPEIPTVPTDISAFNNDAGYITAADIPAATEQVNADWNATEGAAQILNKPELFSGDYNDLQNKPANVSAFNNDAGYITEADVQAAANIPTNVSAFENDANYITDGDFDYLLDANLPENVSYFTNDAGYITADDIPAQVNADWNATEGAAQILNKPELFSGDYNDLTNKPLIPTDLGDFNNSPGYLTIHDLPAQENADWDETDPASPSYILNKPNLDNFVDFNDLNNALDDNLANVAFTGSYNDLSNKPAIPAAPVQSDWNVANQSDLAYIKNKPVIPSLDDIENLINNKVSALNNKIDSLADALETAQSQVENMDNLTFQCGVSKVKDVDGNSYSTILLGNQCWMKESLRVKHAPDGNSINYTIPYNPNGEDVRQGLLYTRPTVMNGEANSSSNPSGVQGICPTGWHVPSKSEFEQMIGHVGAEYGCNGNTTYVAQALAANELWLEVSNQSCVPGNLQGNNASGFSLFPNYGTGGTTNQYWNLYSNLWTSEEKTRIAIENSQQLVSISNFYHETNNFGVRCVRDMSNGIIRTMETMQNTLDSLQNVIADAIGEKATVVITKTFHGDRVNYPEIAANVTNNGGAIVLNKGFCWSTSQNPTVNNNYVIVDTNTNSFVKEFSSLSYGTTYYVRAFATTANGTAYSDQVTVSRKDYYAVPRKGHRNLYFPTDATTLTIYDAGGPDGNYENYWDGYLTIIPQVSGKKVQIIGTSCLTEASTSTSIYDFLEIYQGSVSTNSNNYLARYYSTVSNTPVDILPVAPEATNSNITLRFRSDGSNVAAGFTVVVRLVDRPCNGTSTVSDVDGNTYNTVEIGSQCWMKENLRTTKYPNGTNIGQGSSSSTTTGFRYYPGGNSSNVSTYGYVYNWKAVMNTSSSSSASPSGVQGICPTGWHVPSNAEWTTLTDYLATGNVYGCIGSTYTAKSLAATTGWTASSGTCNVGNNQSTNNSTGFNARPAGLYYYTSAQYFGESALFWSSTQGTSENAYVRWLRYNYPYVWSTTYPKEYMLSVRCVKN